MKKENPDEFKKTIDDILKFLGRKFQGIRLQCKSCGEVAYAKSPEIAEAFGWSSVKQLKGALYEGTCIDCTYPHPPNTNEKGACP